MCSMCLPTVAVRDEPYGSKSMCPQELINYVVICAYVAKKHEAIHSHLHGKPSYLRGTKRPHDYRPLRHHHLSQRHFGRTTQRAHVFAAYLGIPRRQVGTRRNRGRLSAPRNPRRTQHRHRPRPAPYPGRTPLSPHQHPTHSLHSPLPQRHSNLARTQSPSVFAQGGIGGTGLGGGGCANNERIFEL